MVLHFGTTSRGACCSYNLGVSRRGLVGRIRAHFVSYLLDKRLVLFDGQEIEKP